MDFARLIKRLQSISLKWKLLIPFLSLAFVGTITLVYIGLASQHKIIREVEEEKIHNLYRLFLANIEHKKEHALSLALLVAQNPEVQVLLSERDRQGLTDRYLPLYENLKKRPGIKEFSFYIPPGRPFLRFHLLGKGEGTGSERGLVLKSLEEKKPLAGLGERLSGLSIQGVAPVLTKKDRLAGVVEISFPLGENFLRELKQEWNAELALYKKTGKGDFSLLVATYKEKDITPESFFSKPKGHKPAIQIAPTFHSGKATLRGPIRDSSGEVVATVEITMVHSAMIENISRTRNLMIVVALGGLLLSFALIWLITLLFTKPISEIVREASEIASGEKESHLEPRPHDEIGVLTESLNKMVDSLQGRQAQIEAYAATLEARVQERTADLIESEEKFRTLVENLPLIVYRILADGTTEFVNPYFTEKLGYTAEEAVGNKDFWYEKVCGQKPRQTKDFLADCFPHGEEGGVERTIRDTNGEILNFIDYAIPHEGENGEVEWIDGFMVDITELKKLQERDLRTEELRVLSEISTRLAHEIRNPLATAGGFACRLRDSIPEDDQCHEFARIIVEEIERLEKILKVILSSTKPVILAVSEIEINDILRSHLQEVSDRIEDNDITVVYSLSEPSPTLKADEGLLGRSFEILFKYVITTIPQGGKLKISTYSKNTQIIVNIEYNSESLSDEDIEQFFLPRLVCKAEPEALELPFSKVILHRHGGKIDVSRKGAKTIVINIELPVEPPSTTL